MLVLYRKLHESIHIGDDIVIEVAEILENAVRLGITAPKDKLILRSELSEARAQRKKSKRSKTKNKNKVSLFDNVESKKENKETKGGIDSGK